MTTHQVRDPTVIHLSINGRHGILGARHIAEALHIPYKPAPLGTKEGVLLETLFRISEGFFFRPNHLIMATLMYFEEKVHRRSCSEQMLFHFSSPDCYAGFWSTWELGAPTGPEHPEIPHPEHPEEPQLVEIPADMRAPAPTVPSIETIPEEQIIATQTQHTAILSQIQHHLGILLAPEHPIPILSKPTEPSQAPSFIEQTMHPEEPTTGEAKTSTLSIPSSTAEPSSSHHPPATI
ncbi:hypothetical protein CK203_044634 [Vitis vinifera]|uniref:Uncharacterized protein n=1 Tax=Vitis vinifera TaxID=29760 RepID=A0A438HJP3_VITVI|nr:hypothetical protein CK203_044634 [Vitis vinifera]